VLSTSRCDGEGGCRECAASVYFCGSGCNVLRFANPTSAPHAPQLRFSGSGALARRPVSRRAPKTVPIRRDSATHCVIEACDVKNRRPCGRVAARCSGPLPSTRRRGHRNCQLLIEVAVVDAPIPPDRHEVRAHQPVYCRRIEVPHKKLHVPGAALNAGVPGAGERQAGGLFRNPSSYKRDRSGAGRQGAAGMLPAGAVCRTVAARRGGRGSLRSA